MGEDKPMEKKSMENQPLQFEQAMERLEQIVERLESGDVALEDAIELFQEGMKLSQLCGQKLDQIERKIELLVEEDGEWAKKAIDPPQENEGEAL